MAGRDGKGAEGKKMDAKVKKLVQDYLDATEKHFASHSGANYSYLTENSFDYSRVSSFPVSIEDAWEDGTIRLTADGIYCDTTLLPHKWDATKIRRRIEDALRKTVDLSELLRIAAVIRVRLD